MGKVIFQSSGLHTSLQDLGRYGFRKYGIPISGAMDQESSKLANLLVKNPADKAVMEVTQIGPELTFDEPTLIAITGADLSPHLNGSPITNNKAIPIRSGDILTFGAPKRGLRTYMSIKGGFLYETVMNSQSMFVPVTPKAKFTKGNQLGYQANYQSIENFATIRTEENHFENPSLAVFPGPEFHWLDQTTQSTLLNSEFTIGTNNRMGYQLSNTEMPTNDFQMLTSPVIPGTIQLTPSGKLMALMRDAQVTGGYPRILQLTEKSINRLAQKGSGQVVNFNLIDI